MSFPSVDLSLARYADWKAPTGDGAVLLWPEAASLTRIVEENRHRLSLANVRLLDTPLSELRAAARAWVGHHHDAPIIATGHQTELWHSGVWIKNAVIHHVAERSAGRAYHFAVDTDSPKHLQLKWPGSSAAITDDTRLATAAWSGLLDAPSPAHLQHLRTKLASASAAWGFEPVAFEFFETLQPLALDQPRVSYALCRALHGLDWSLGLKYDGMIVSPILDSPPFLQFVAYVLANARRFADDYNTALHDYRDEHGMTTNSRPMPDLFISHEAIELPFWLDDLATGKRSRPSVFEQNGSIVLKLVNGAEFAIAANEPAESAAVRLRNFLAMTSHRLAPRALTLTLYLRLFIADFFVHGIGGGRYDQVLDKLIYRHFGVVPPQFAVATGTLHFPTAVNRSRACVACVARKGHQLRHRALGSQKQKYLDVIAAAPRGSRERAVAFAEMQSALRARWPSDPQLADWERRLNDERQQEQRDAVEFDRELFYGVQPRDRLMKLIDQVRAML